MRLVLLPTRGEETEKRRHACECVRECEYCTLYARRDAPLLGSALALDVIESVERQRRTRTFAVDALEGAASIIRDLMLAMSGLISSGSEATSNPTLSDPMWPTSDRSCWIQWCRCRI